MTNQEILARIDHTALKVDVTWETIAQLCKEAVEHRTASVCIPSCYVRRAKVAFPTLRICTVIGFPLGYQSAFVKQVETAEAIADGAEEIDMVINQTAMKNHEDAIVLEEIQQVRRACAGQVLKVIIETCNLTEDEKIRACKLVTEGGADYIKTSTGFGSAGAKLEDIALFRAHIGSHVKMKAAGGIRTREDMIAFLEAGCDRLGTSAASILFDET